MEPDQRGLPNKETPDKENPRQNLLRRRSKAAFAGCRQELRAEFILPNRGQGGLCGLKLEAEALELTEGGPLGTFV